MIYHIMLQYVEKYDRLMMLLYNIISFLFVIIYIEKKGMISWITLHIKEMKLMAKKNC